MEPIRINVGGQVFTTLMSTLSSRGTNMITRMLESTIPCSRLDGDVFIDRNPELFAHCLEFLRSGRTPPKSCLADVLGELDYYCIAHDIKAITTKQPSLAKLALNFIMTHPYASFQVDNRTLLGIQTSNGSWTPCDHPDALAFVTLMNSPDFPRFVEKLRLKNICLTFWMVGPIRFWYKK